MNNPFEHKGFTEKNGVLAKTHYQPVGGERGDDHREHGVAVAADFQIKPSTDEQKLNKLEKKYLVNLRRLNPPYIGIQNITLKLGDDCRYTPDFNTIDENGRFVFHETKGFMRDDALVKLKVAARIFPMFKFVLVKLTKGLCWDIEEVKS